MRIAIYGGTFNPIHIGHTSLAQSLVEQQIVDEVWLIVIRRIRIKGRMLLLTKRDLQWHNLRQKGWKAFE